MNTTMETLSSKLAKALRSHANKNAIYVSGAYYKYSEFSDQSFLVSNMILRTGPSDCPFVGIFGYRSIHTYTAIAGALLSGRAYLPLNPQFPAARLRTMLESASCRVLVLSEECADAFAELATQTKGFLVICPYPGQRIKQLSGNLMQHTFLFPQSDNERGHSGLPSSKPEDPAYLLFTSGSTGAPKGVVVSHKNVCAYLDHVIAKYRVTNGDRVSQMFDITFDLSVHDIFVSLLSGACLFVVPGTSLMSPAKFIKDNQLSIWFSVPSVAMFMERMRLLKPDSFPSLRCSLFCGEALPQRSVEAWQAAAPGSAIENLYGPTEATIAITSYRWDPARSPSDCVNGLVPIGWPFPGQQVRVVDHDTSNFDSDRGELYLAGSQVTAGYLNAPEQTAERFVRIDGSGLVWYRTGDLVGRQSEDCLVYLGRMDDQLQIRGFRAELQEIDREIRKAAGTDMAVCVPRLLGPGQAECVIAVIEGSKADFSVRNILESCKRTLPEYMVPTEVRFVERMPLNTNGKIDRKSLTQ